jgi:hypothetical protein
MLCFVHKSLPATLLPRYVGLPVRVRELARRTRVEGTHLACNNRRRLTQRLPVTESLRRRVYSASNVLQLLLLSLSTN